MGNDNSLTQTSCRELLSAEVSLSTICREIKAAGLSRKRIKKRANVVLSQQNIIQRQQFSSHMLGKLNRSIFFLNESGFNLHTSINYGYSPVNEDAFLYQPASRGQNISLCALISINGLEHYKLIDGAYNEHIFIEFLTECSSNGVFNNNPILVMDNVAFHHCSGVKLYLESIGVEIVYLPLYSPDLNPKENVFSTIKSRLNIIKQRANERSVLKSRILTIIQELGNFEEYFRHFWRTVNSVKIVKNKY